jgi:anti-anti-sigma factor
MGNDSSILYNSHNETILFKLIGEIRHSSSAGFNAAIARLFGQTSTTNVVIDLRETTYIDSTNLGLIGIIARNLWKINKTKPTLIIQRNDVYELLLSMGFENYFHMVESCTDGTDDLQPLKNSDPADASTILKAHETLIEMSENNRSKFRDLVELLKVELHRIEE